MKNRLNFIFNAHLPFVRHPEYPKFLEEDWLFEAINESYIPLLRMMNKLKDEGLSFNLTFSLSPTLCAMLTDARLNERFLQYMENHIQLGLKEIERLSGDSDLLNLAIKYKEDLSLNLDYYVRECSSNLLSAFNKLANEGYVEIITTTATHAYLPVYKDYPIAVNAQIETGVLEHMRNFDKLSEGFWLPECGYYPGLEDLLKRHNISWVSLPSQAIVLSEDKPLRGSYAPIRCPNGLYCFVRDFNLASLVWSATEGYPCDPIYREFYRDIGYDLPLDYIKDYIHEPEVRVFTGFKYWAITGNVANKVVYDYKKAQERTVEHAKNFIYNVRMRSDSISDLLDVDPLYTISFDAELFGHWWYEGISWLENLIRLVNESSDIEFINPSKFIKEKHELQVMRPAPSSWGVGGYSQVWVDNSTNAWAYRHIFKAIERMTDLANRFPNQKSLKQRFLNQAARETMLLMASDWTFIIHNQTSDYAKKRLEGHIQNLNLVYDNMCKNAVNTEWLVKAEKRNNLFPNFDYNIMKSTHLNEVSPIYTTDFTAKK